MTFLVVLTGWGRPATLSRGWCTFLLPVERPSDVESFRGVSADIWRPPRI